jgi:2,3-bisphosphoglycerate-independent phosphoglycerate mutase
MKYVVLIGDGMAGRPLAELGGRSCLQAARTPNMDQLAIHGEVGIAHTIPDGFEPGSDVANMSILGYDPSRYYSGRAPVEAVYRGIKLGPRDVAYRCNLVTLSGPLKDPHTVMRSFSAGHISTREASTLVKEINRRLGGKGIAFYPGVSYRHLMVWKDGREKMVCTPPHDISGQKINGCLPSGRGNDVLIRLMDESAGILSEHPVNKKRLRAGELPATNIWLWGQGRRMKIPDFGKKYGLKGALISAVDLTKGLALCAGMQVIEVKGATGYLDTNYEGKARAALKALGKLDFVYVHVEAPDEAGHMGDVKAKIRAIEDFDREIVGRILQGLKEKGDFRLLIMPDHATPVRAMTHTREAVPFLIYDSRCSDRKSRMKGYSERIRFGKNIRIFESGYELMDYFIIDAGKAGKGQ